MSKTKSSEQKMKHDLHVSGRQEFNLQMYKAGFVCFVS